MASIPTLIDLLEAARAEALLGPTKFDIGAIDTVGSDINVVFAANAAMGEEVARFTQLSFNESHLATSNEDALDRWVFDRYRLVRQEATSARATLSLSRSAPTAGVTVPEGSAFATADGVTFNTLNDAVFPAASAGPILVDAVAAETGTVGNVDAGKIVVVASTLDDSTIAVTNPGPAAGGDEAESDEDLRGRAQDFFLTARRGTKEAIEFGATQTEGIEQATAAEILDPETGDPALRVTLTIADVNGQANTALSALVLQELDEFRALGVPVTVNAGVQQLVTVTASGLQFEAGFNTSTVLAEARNVILANVNALAPGEILRQALILSSMQEVLGLIVPDTALTEPVGDVVPNAGAVIRTTLSRIDLTG